MFIEAAFDDHVDLDRVEAGGGCSVDAFDDFRYREVDVVHRLEHGVVHRVEADGDAFETGVTQRLCFFGEQRAVGSQRQVEAGNVGQQFDQLLDVAAHQRFATGEADFFDAVCFEDTRQSRDLFEGQQGRAFEELMIAAELLLGHAIDAAEVAAVGDRDAQVAQGPVEAVSAGGFAGVGNCCGHVVGREGR